MILALPEIKSRGSNFISYTLFQELRMKLGTLFINEFIETYPVIRETRHWKSCIKKLPSNLGMLLVTRFGLISQKLAHEKR